MNRDFHEPKTHWSNPWQQIRDEQETKTSNSGYDQIRSEQYGDRTALKSAMYLPPPHSFVNFIYSSVPPERHHFDNGYQQQRNNCTHDQPARVLSEHDFAGTHTQQTETYQILPGISTLLHSTQKVNQKKSFNRCIIGQCKKTLPLPSSSERIGVGHILRSESFSCQTPTPEAQKLDSIKFKFSRIAQVQHISAPHSPIAKNLTIDRPPSKSTKLCAFHDCKKNSKAGGFCIRHGGGLRCYVVGCNKHVVSKGVCIGHGGGKLCKIPGCKSSARKKGVCWSHGGNRSCEVKNCVKSAKLGGLCAVHRYDESQENIVTQKADAYLCFFRPK